MTDDLISRQALIAEIMRRGIYPPGVRHAIENAPAIDAVPVVMRLIDCHKAKRAIYQHKTQRLQKETVLKILDAVPTIDAVPVVRGKWENPSFIDPEDNLDPRMKCSECGEVDTPLARWNYCPKCGARMDGDINETD